MDPSRFIQNVIDTGARSRYFDLGLLRRSIAAGILDGKFAETTAYFLADEFSGVEGADDFARAKYLHGDEAPPFQHFCAHCGIDDLSARFPETADAYSTVLAISPEGGGHVAVDELIRGKRAQPHLEDSIWWELQWQSILEDHFINGAMLAALGHIRSMDELSPLLEAHSFLTSLNAENVFGRVVGFEESMACAIQVPLLGTLIMVNFFQAGKQPRFARIGPHVRVEIEGSTVQLDVHSLGVIDRPIMVKDLRPAKGRVISLPVSKKFVEEDIWELAGASPFFITHPYRLLPSDFIWGSEFPTTVPTRDLINKIVSRELPYGMQIVSDRHQNPKGNGVSYIMDKGGRQFVLHGRARRGKSDDEYTFIAKHGEVKGGKFRRDTELDLDIRGGKITGARYRLGSDRELIVDVDERRIRDLVARAGKSPNPAQGGSAGGTGGDDVIGAHPIIRGPGSVLYPFTAPMIGSLASSGFSCRIPQMVIPRVFLR